MAKLSFQPGNSVDKDPFFHVCFANAGNRAMPGCPHTATAAAALL